ncbi:hypothetical protein ACFYQA_39195 [Streptomyces sp. NPDC005774]|uniref:hypothetical protein n=1 Tax=Streptomyces sp. NPDC005774 TaxID=3364728 RepID=UPI0036943171
MSERTNLTHRGGGLRVTCKVKLAPGATTVDVERDQEMIVERADAPRTRRPGRALPPGRGR